MVAVAPIMRTPLRSLALSVLVLAAAACGSHPTVFPPGLEPLEATNTATLPPATATDPHPEAIVFTTGITRTSTADTFWVHGRAYVQASLDQVWAAARDVEVCVDRRKVASWTTMPIADPMYDVSFLVHNVVMATLTLEFDVTWRQSAVDGPRDHPNVVAFRFQKTNGTDIIGMLEGSVVVTRIDDHTTQMDFIEHLQSLGGSVDIPRSYLADFYASIVARVHGRPLPTYP